VIAAGRLVEEASFDERRRVSPIGYGSVKGRKLSASDFAVTGDGASTPVIGVIPRKIITDCLELSLPSKDGVMLCDAAQDVIKVAVVERHGVNGNIGRGFVKGFGLTRGAIGSSVGHDSHNICVVGADDGDMAAAVNRLIEIGGGFVVVENGRVLAELALPIAGLMSDRSFEEVREALIPLRAAAKFLGTKLPEPFLQVAFLPLPVIPHLKISDRGLVDVDRFCLLQ
jgi:adenine deaminase